MVASALTVSGFSPEIFWAKDGAQDNTIPVSRNNFFMANMFSYLMQKERVLHKHFLIFVAHGENSKFRYTHDAAAPGH